MENGWLVAPVMVPAFKLATVEVWANHMAMPQDTGWLFIYLLFKTKVAIPASWEIFNPVTESGSWRVYWCGFIDDNRDISLSILAAPRLSPSPTHHFLTSPHGFLNLRPRSEFNHHVTSHTCALHFWLSSFPIDCRDFGASFGFVDLSAYQLLGALVRRS